MRPRRRIARHRQGDGNRRPVLSLTAVLAVAATLVAATAVVRQLADADPGAPSTARGDLSAVDVALPSDPWAGSSPPGSSTGGSSTGGSSTGGGGPAVTAGASPSSSRPTRFTGDKLLFGIGTEANDGVRTRLATEAPTKMLTSWYNKPADLAWMTGWQDDVVPDAYAAGYAMHLIVFTDKPEGDIPTEYGTACGRPYPMSASFLADMKRLATTFAGASAGPSLYVTLFTEVQTYACVDNSYSPDAPTTAYYRALKDSYVAARKIFKETAPNAKVSLGWGGWQARYDDPAKGGGKSMIGQFADVLSQSDFQSFQAMQSDHNVSDIRGMVRLLAPYGPVMLAHYKPDNSSQATFDRDVRSVLNDAFVREITAAGLFALSFMDDQNLKASQGTYQFVLSAVHRFGRVP